MGISLVFCDTNRQLFVAYTATASYIPEYPGNFFFPRLATPEGLKTADNRTAAILRVYGEPLVRTLRVRSTPTPSYLFSNGLFIVLSSDPTYFYAIGVVNPDVRGGRKPSGVYIPWREGGRSPGSRPARRVTQTGV